MHAEQSHGRSFRHRFEGPFFRRVFLSGVRGIPQPLQRASMPLWAGIFYALVPSARRGAEKNLARIIGATVSTSPTSPTSPTLARGLKRRSFRLFVNYAQSITNMYALHLGRRVPVETRFVGRENLLRVQAEGRGAIVVTGHLGAWGIAPFLLEGKGLPPMTMAMAQEPNAELAEFEKQFRARFKIVYTTGSPFAAIELASIVRRGELVGMQLDRHLGGPHVMVPFFGKPAPFPLGPATLARVSGCPIIPMFAIMTGRSECTFVVETPIEVAHTRDKRRDIGDAMAATVEVYERYVRAHPEQWFNFHDFWRAPT